MCKGNKKVTAQKWKWTIIPGLHLENQKLWLKWDSKGKIYTDLMYFKGTSFLWEEKRWICLLHCCGLWWIMTMPIGIYLALWVAMFDLWIGVSKQIASDNTIAQQSCDTYNTFWEKLQKTVTSTKCGYYPITGDKTEQNWLSEIFRKAFDFGHHINPLKR